jgi:probable rRNA maturation factor
MDPEPALSIDVVAESGDWSGFAVEDRIAPIAGAIARRLPQAQGEVVLALADDATVRDLNERFRGKDKATNVLSFPSGGEPGRGAPLGDVILAVETLRREAEAEGKAPGDHFAHLAIHGILHLLGYDHESADDAERMENLETAILADLGIADPYAEPQTERATVYSQAR